MGEFSLSHILLLLVVFLIFFGPSRLPQLGESFGKAIRGFKKGLHEIDADAKDITSTQNSQIANQERQALPQNAQPKATEQTTQHSDTTKNNS